MAFAPGFWNRRGVLTVHHNFSKRNARKNGIEKEDIIDLVKSLGAVHGVLEEPQLWAEASIVQTLIYKRSNHKKEKYFQGLKKIAKCLNRLQELRIFDKVAKINDQFPKLTEQGSLKMETISNYPSIESIICLLGYLNGAAQLLLQVLSTCKETFHQCCFHLVGGFFVTWLLTCCSSLSRIWALSRSLYNHISACYNALFPWMNYLSDPHQVKNSEAKYLPVNLLQLDKLTIGQHNQSSNALTPYETATQWTLEELFGSEKQIHEELSCAQCQ
ncbi:nucleolus and neural progenitor protein-like isoform X4 [Acropora palmata]|uniref:nucleolus and neural progenitor protein-like isoform X4 n=1 Tax=Acropora palmata TaxID=6131 RepID=UPI003DA0A7C7